MTYGGQEKAFKALKERNKDNKDQVLQNPIKENPWLYYCKHLWTDLQEYKMAANIREYLDLITMDELLPALQSLKKQEDAWN